MKLKIEIEMPTGQTQEAVMALIDFAHAMQSRRGDVGQGISNGFRARQRLYDTGGTTIGFADIEH